MHQDRKITFTTSPGVYFNTSPDQKLLDPAHAEEREQGLSCPKVEAGDHKDCRDPSFTVTSRLLLMLLFFVCFCWLCFLAFLCLYASRNFSFLGSSLRFYSLPHPLLLHPRAATAPSPEYTGRGCNPSYMFTGIKAAPLLTTLSRSVKFFGENERLFIQAYSPLYWLDSNKWEEADGLPQNIRIMA